MLGIVPVERVTGIEPALSAWEAEVLPLNYTRLARNPSKTLGSKAVAQTTRSMVFGQTHRLLTALGIRPPENGTRRPLREDRSQRQGSSLNVACIPNNWAMTVKFDSWEDARRVFYSEFETAVRKYEPLPLLLELSRYSASQPEFMGMQDRWRTIAPWTISAIARQAIMSSNRAGHLQPDNRGFRRMLNLFRQIDITPASGFDIYSFMAGAAHEQSAYQISVKEDLSRTLAVLVDTPTTNPQQLSETQLDRLVGAPIRDLAMSTFVLYGLARANGGVITRASIHDLVRDAPGKVPSAESLLGTLDRLTATIDEARADGLSVKQFKGGLQKYGYNPLTRTPFIRIHDEAVMAPQTHFVLQACSLEAIYYLGQRGGLPNFSSDLGLRVEAYTGRQLRHSGLLEVHPEISWRGKKSIDWFVVTPEATVFIECKSAHTTLDIRAGAQSGAQDVAAKLGPAVTQINRTVEQIRAGNPAFSMIPSDRPLVGLIATAEPIYLPNALEVRQHMPTPDVPTVTISLRDLEHSATLDASTFGSTMLRIASDPELSTLDAFASIGQVLGKSKQNRRNDLIDESFERHLNMDRWKPGAAQSVTP
jgi:hypothetical protein